MNDYQENKNRNNACALSTRRCHNTFMAYLFKRIY